MKNKFKDYNKIKKKNRNTGYDPILRYPHVIIRMNLLAKIRRSTTLKE